MFQNINWMNQQSCFNQLIFRMIQMSVSRVQQLRHQNSQLKQRILFIKNQNSTVDLQAEVSRFVEESKKNLNEMHKKIEQQSAKQSVLIHTATAKYQGVLRNQIELLTFNKKLSQDKENQDKVFSEGVEKMTVEYQNRIKAFQSKVKTNVKRIQELSNGGSMIARLLGNPRFRKAMQERGCSLQAIENQSKLQEVSQEVQEKDREIQEAEQKSARLDEQMTKMHELIDTMKSLLQNLMKEKENILKQNGTLKEKLRQSEVLIAKLLGESLPEEEEEAEVSQNQQQDKDDEQQLEAGQRQQEGN